MLVTVQQYTVQTGHWPGIIRLGWAESLCCCLSVSGWAPGEQHEPARSRSANTSREKVSRRKELDLRSIMSSPRTGNLSLIKVNSGQDKDVYD